MRPSLRFSRFALALVVLGSATGGHAAEKPVLRIDPLVRLARVYVERETESFNRRLADPAGARGRAKRQLRAFAANGMQRIDPDFAIAKCVFAEGDFANLLDRTLTLSDDETYAKKSLVLDVRDVYGHRIYTAIYDLCARAREAFRARLETARFAGADAPIAIDATERDRIASAIFLPTLAGKRSLLQGLQDRDVGFALLSAGATAGYLFGLVLPGVILSGFWMMDETNALLASANGAMPARLFRNLPTITHDGAGLDLVFTDEEAAEDAEITRRGG